MKDAIGNWLFHLAAAFGSAVYVLMKPDEKWARNIVKFVIGYLCAMFTSSLLLSVFQWFFGFTPESYDNHLAATGFITGVLGMTFYDTVATWIQSDLRPILADIVKSWLKKKD